MGIKTNMAAAGAAWLSIIPWYLCMLIQAWLLKPCDNNLNKLLI